MGTHMETHFLAKYQSEERRQRLSSSTSRTRISSGFLWLKQATLRRRCSNTLIGQANNFAATLPHCRTIVACYGGYSTTLFLLTLLRLAAALFAAFHLENLSRFPNFSKKTDAHGIRASISRVRNVNANQSDMVALPYGARK